MAVLTPTKVQTLLDSNTYCPCVTVNGAFLQYEFMGKLDGKNYYCNTQDSASVLEDGTIKTDLLALDENSTGTDIRTALKNYFEAEEDQGAADVIDPSATVDISAV